MNKLGVNVGEGVTNFQDLSYNVYVPTKRLGNFTLFGFGGLSSQTWKAEKDSSTWTDIYQRLNSKFHANTGASGITHFYTLNSNTYLKTSLLISGTSNGYSDELLNEEYVAEHLGDQELDQTRISLSTTLTKKLSSRHNFKAGVTGNSISYSFFRQYLNEKTEEVELAIDQDGNAFTFQSFLQWSYHVTEKLTLNGGLHFITLADNNTASVEPRASLKYQLNPAQAFSLGYGMHSQVQPLGVYYVKKQRPDSSWYQPNKDLDLTRSQHVVLAYDRSLSEFFRVKAEAYYQHLTGIPVSTDAGSTFAIINKEEGYATESLVNKGTGRNYGLELTLEQFMHKDLYFLLSASFYDSKYKAADDNWYNTRYNGNYNFSFTAGKEIKTGEKFRNRILGLNIKSVYSGGMRQTPINKTASEEAGYAVYYENEAFTDQVKDYFRADIRLSLKRNRPKSTVTWALDIQNVANYQNVYGEVFDPHSGKTKTYYQTPLIPILSYRVEF